jgi:hypothetical protein
MLNEIALTPDVFDGSLYSSQEACGIHLRYIREPLLSEVLVRNLRKGAWSNYIAGATGRWHLSGKELFKKLATQNRLRTFETAGETEPKNDDEWCEEAIVSSGVENLEVILTTDTIATSHKECALVHPVEKATNSKWWQGRSPSRIVPRNIDQYQDVLKLVLSNANSLIFVDPHLDPSQLRYSNFIRLLLAAKRSPAAVLEVHRACYEGSGPSRQIFTGSRRADLENRFRESWRVPLEQLGIKVSVFVWPDLHDRALISNLIGMRVSNGFDESNDASETVTFSRLGREDADKVQRDVDPAVNKPIYSFQVP